MHAEVEWGASVSREALVHPVVREEASTAVALRHEYLRAMVDDGSHYSLQVEQSIVAEDGSAVTQQRHVHFQLIQHAHGSHRAHVMPFVAMMHDVSNIAHLAWNVQFESRSPQSDA